MNQTQRQPDCCPAYPARVLERPVVDARGIRHTSEEAREELPWSRICWAIAAEVGEPEGVRTIVFDLVTEADGDPGGRLDVLRLDAEPGEDAIALARAIVTALGDSQKIPTIRSLATDGIPARWYPDLRSFEEEASVELAALER
jgi:hypothetical protein